MDQPKTAYIYALIDPRDEEIRYVGVTKYDPEVRLDGHLKERACQGHRRHWLNQLRRMGLVPRIQVVQEVPFDFRWEAEIYWIAYFRRVGCHLVNDTDGGEGSRGHVPTAETRAKISTNTKRQMADPEQRRKVSKVHKGKTISVEHRIASGEATRKRWAEWRANGAYTSPETRAKISAARKAHPTVMTAKHREKMLIAAKRPKSAEHRAKMSLAHKGKSKPWATECARRMAEANRGKKQSSETIQKRLATQAANRAAKQEALCQSST